MIILKIYSLIRTLIIDVPEALLVQIMPKILIVNTMYQLALAVVLEEKGRFWDKRKVKIIQKLGISIRYTNSYD